MKKLAQLIMIIPLFLFLSVSNAFCTMISKLEAKRAKGKATSIVYEYDWETVYDAAQFVIRHSENYIVYANGFDYAKEEKAIYFIGPGPGVGFFFKPLEDNRAEVDYVKIGVYTTPSAIVNAVIEELPYLLENGQKAYREYTHKLKLQKERERQEERKNRNF